jgi:hypothetical protein
MKVAEPRILARLQSELMKPQALAYVSKAVEREARKALAAPQDGWMPSSDNSTKNAGSSRT